MAIFSLPHHEPGARRAQAAGPRPACTNGRSHSRPLTQVIPGYHLQHLFLRFALTIRRMYLHDLMAEK